jgi:RNA recognition motif-containing protein
MNIYVGNLPFTITDNELRDLFAAHGAVSSAKVILDRDSGRPRGFGFVEMPSSDEAKAAIQALNGKTVGDRELRVNEAQSGARTGGGGGRRPRGGGPRGGGGGGGGDYSH